MTNSKREARIRRHRRVRKKIRGTPERPRLSVFRSARHVYAQVIDDVHGQTLATASTTESGLRTGRGGTVDAAKAVGKLVGERAKAAGISSVVFDRGGFKFHGRVAGLAAGAREAGLEL
jgi:large subunit ribosomal protein L18